MAFITEKCFTCSKKSVNFHKISDPVGDSKQKVCHIICLHFWFKEDDLGNVIVCETCWKKVEQFHQFYLDVKTLHEHNELVPPAMFIKQEETTIEETQLQENYIDKSAEDQELFYLNVKTLHEHNELAPQSICIKQEEITIEETQLQENCMDISAEEQKLDCKHEMPDLCNELLKEEKPAEVPHLKKEKQYTKRQPNKRVVIYKNPQSRKPTPEERQAEDNFIKQHTHYICGECDIEFETFRAIQNHQIKTHNRITIVCCGNQHRTRAMLYQHVQSLLDPEAFKCDICGKSFKSKISYIRHKVENHAAEEDLVFKCNRCPKSFIKERLLRTHLAEHETLENGTAKCEFCGKCFRTKSILNRHVKANHKEPTDFICEVCSKGFYLRSMFLEHHKTHELTAEQLKEQCPVCSRWLNNHTHWMQHVRRHKEGECRCEVCGHMSKDMKSLERHMKARHTPDQKRHACEQCGKDFARVINLKEHVANVHTREHLYQCEHCEKKFFSSSLKYSHRKKDHPQEWLESQKARRDISVGGETVA